MNNAIKVFSVTRAELAALEYDIQICALGYEMRATAVAKASNSSMRSRIAFGFNHNQLLSYADNLAWFNSNRFEIKTDLLADEFGKSFSESLDIRLGELDNLGRTLRICVDISCLDRRRLAEIVHYFRSSLSCPAQIDFWYCIAEFQSPHMVLGRNEIAGPVHRRFAGRFTEPGRPLALIAGLGYEVGRVMGAAEYLQASKVIALIPESPIVEYEEEVLRANKTMLDELQPRQVVKYSVDDPVRTIALLDATLRGLSLDYNVVMLPSGPKMLVLCSLLAQSMYPTSAVWRISSGGSIAAREVIPSSNFVGLRWIPDSKE
jgi:hypothetical protein